MIEASPGRSIALPVLLLLPAAGVQGQEHPHTSPYRDLLHREIKALSAREVDGLLRGEGMGMALPAEMHGYPGPRHVLDLAPSLDLTAAQRAEVEEIFHGMRARATALGREIVALERVLDAAFAEATIDHEELERLTGEIGARRGELRAAHLRAHLRLASVLTREQRHRYDRLRGYGDHR